MIISNLTDTFWEKNNFLFLVRNLNFSVDVLLFLMVFYYVVKFIKPITPYSNIYLDSGYTSIILLDSLGL